MWTLPETVDCVSTLVTVNDDESRVEGADGQMWLAFGTNAKGDTNGRSSNSCHPAPWRREHEVFSI
jgi:hypothetical protein